MKLWHWLLLVLLLFGAGVAFAKFYWPSIIQPPPKVIRVDRPIARRDTSTIARPKTRIIYRTVKELVRDTIYVPTGFTGVGVISASPIRFQRGQVVLTYFGLADTAFVQDRFTIPRPNFGYNLSSVTGYDPLLGVVQIGLEASARYRRLTVYGRAETSVRNQSLTIGVRFRLYGVE